MESYQNTIEMFSKLSHCSYVLMFYGQFPECHVLMTSLYSKSKHGWDKNQTAFWNILQFVRKKFIYSQEFDEQVSAYLLHNQNFRKYELELTVNDFDIFKDFVEKTNYQQNLGFSRLAVDTHDLKKYNDLINYLRDIPGFKMECIQPIVHTFYKDIDQKFEYLREVNFKNVKLAKELGFLTCSFEQKELSNQLSSLEIPVRTLYLSEGSMSGKDPIQPSKVLQNSVKKIIVGNINPKKVHRIKSTYQTLHKSFPNLQKIEIELKTFSIGAFCQICHLRNEGAIEDIKMGEYSEESSTVIKNYARVFVRSFDETGKAKLNLFKVKKLTLQYAKPSSLLYKKDGLIVLNNCKYVEMVGTICVTNDEPLLFDKFVQFYENPPKAVGKESLWFAMSSKDIDYHGVKVSKTADILNIECKLLKIKIMHTSKDKTFDNLLLSLKTIKPETMIDLNILSYYGSYIDYKVEKLLYLIEDDRVISIKIPTFYTMSISTLKEVYELIFKSNKIQQISLGEVVKSRLNYQTFKELFKDNPEKLLNAHEYSKSQGFIKQWMDNVIIKDY